MDVIDYATFQALRIYLFIGTVTAVVLFGAFLTLGIATVRRLHGLPSLPRHTFYMMASIVVVITLLFVALVTSVSTLLYALLGLSTGKTPMWPVPAIFGCSAFALSIGDGLFIYRCWIIWGRSHWVIVPALIFCAELATSYYSIVQAALRSRVQVADIVGLLEVSPRATAAGVAGIILTILLNTLLAGAAITRLLLARRELRAAALPGGGAHYVRISLVLAISTVVYATVWIPMLAWCETVRITPYYVALFALVAAMPLVVMLHAGSIRTEAPYHLPRLRGEGDERRDSPSFPSSNGDRRDCTRSFRRDSCSIFQ